MVIYIFPLVLDLVLFLVIGRVADTAGREHWNDWKNALLIGSQSITYVPACFAIGCFLRRSNAKYYLVASTILTMLVNIPLLFTHSFWVALPLMSVLGVTSAIFFNSAQTVMRGDVPPGTLSRTISLYNIAWSGGIAAGFLFGGLLNFAGGSWALAVLSTALCCWILHLIFTHKSRPLEHASADGQIEAPLPGAPRFDGRYIFSGWMLAMIMNFTQRPIFAFYPEFYAERGYREWVAGTVLFTMVVMQAAASAAGPRLRRWFYSRRLLIWLHLAMVIALGMCWATVHSVLLSLVPLIILGSIFGLFIYVAIYYVSNDVHSNFNVGVNEAMVGLGNSAGPLVCEAIMAACGYRYAFYPTSMALALVLLCWQLIRLRRPYLPPSPNAVFTGSEGPGQLSSTSMTI